MYIQTYIIICKYIDTVCKFYQCSNGHCSCMLGKFGKTLTNFSKSGCDYNQNNFKYEI